MDGRVEYEVKSCGVETIPNRFFNLSQIMDSGQCFRISKKDDCFVAVTGYHAVKIVEKPDHGYLFCCSEYDFENIWFPYFDMGTDYAVFQKAMEADRFLNEAMSVAGGIRILRQDFWEMVVTYIISQRNNIPKIRKSVETLCRERGIPIDVIDGNIIYAFPNSEQLRGRNLSNAGLGYREKYVTSAVDREARTWSSIAEMDDSKAKEALIKMPGIGEKVANCILLFGLHRLNSYPRDVWVNRMIDEVYHGEFDEKKYSGFSGYVQQIQFYYYRMKTRGDKIDC